MSVARRIKAHLNAPRLRDRRAGSGGSTVRGRHRVEFSAIATLVNWLPIPDSMEPIQNKRKSRWRNGSRKSRFAD
jgi:hypothetical protein